MQRKRHVVVNEVEHDAEDCWTSEHNIPNIPTCDAARHPFL